MEPPAKENTAGASVEQILSSITAATKDQVSGDSGAMMSALMRHKTVYWR